MTNYIIRIQIPNVALVRLEPIQIKSVAQSVAHKLAQLHGEENISIEFQSTNGESMPLAAFLGRN
ncbi:hypothetical protein [Acinetobacter baumannii]|uniref:hypothetical protein n=1 Tax=Acinetobacter baumannii TaxID=470 RepID=UPI001920FFA9|nr:hypothetical protein [Acinetobacter baumannii]MBL1375553.1 hypothetical protein [Acinetobacter baumannii]